MSNNTITNVINETDPAQFTAIVEGFYLRVYGMGTELGAARQAAAALATQLAISDEALIAFFTLMKKEQVPRERLKPRLIEIATSYNELVSYFERARSSTTINEHELIARRAIEVGDFDLAERELALSQEVSTRQLQLELGVSDDPSAASRATLSNTAAHIFERGLLSMIKAEYAEADENFRMAFEAASRSTIRLPCDVQQYPLFRSRAMNALARKRDSDVLLQETIDLTNSALGNLVELHCPITTWSEIHVELGRAYATLAKHQGSNDKLRLSLQSYEAAVNEVAVPLSYRLWYEIQRQIGFTYWTLGEVDATIDALRRGISPRMRETSSLEWANVQVVVGHALLRKSDGQDAQLEREASVLFNEALNIVGEDFGSAVWASAQFGLGTAQMMRGLREKGASSLEAALSMLKKTEHSITPEHDYESWARLHLNMATCLNALGDLLQSPDRYSQAMEQYQLVVDRPSSERNLLIRKEGIDGLDRVRSKLYYPRRN